MKYTSARLVFKKIASLCTVLKDCFSLRVTLLAKIDFSSMRSTSRLKRSLDIYVSPYMLYFCPLELKKIIVHQSFKMNASCLVPGTTKVATLNISGRKHLKLNCLDIFFNVFQHSSKRFLHHSIT